MAYETRLNESPPLVGLAPSFTPCLHSEFVTVMSASFVPHLQVFKTCGGRRHPIAQSQPSFSSSPPPPCLRPTFSALAPGGFVILNRRQEKHSPATRQRRCWEIERDLHHEPEIIGGVISDEKRLGKQQSLGKAGVFLAEQRE